MAFLIVTVLLLNPAYIVIIADYDLTFTVLFTVDIASDCHLEGSIAFIFIVFFNHVSQSTLP